jgi:hypothetical protein
LILMLIFGLMVLKRFLKPKKIYNQVLQLESGTENQLRNDQDEQYDKIVFGDEIHPMIEISRFIPSKKYSFEDVPINNSIIINIQPLFNQAPNILSNAVNMVTDKYILRFAPDVANGLSNGSLKMMGEGTRAIAVSSTTNKTAGMAILEKASGVNIATVTLGIWQLMAVITAQKYLLDINKRLAYIENSLNDIKDWLTNDLLGKIIGNFNYLKQINCMLKKNDLNDSEIDKYENQLEHIERECGQIMESLLLTLRKKRESYSSLKFQGMGIKSHYKEIINYLNENERNMSAFLSTLYVRTVAIQLKCSFPGNKEIVKLRIDELVSQYSEQKCEQDKFQEKVNNSIQSLKGSFLCKEKTNQQYQTRLKDCLSNSCLRIEDLFKHTGELISFTSLSINQQIIEFNQPIQLEVTLDKNREIGRVRKIISCN